MNRSAFLGILMCFVCARVLGEPGRLKMATERIVVFKDGYGLFLRKATGTTDARGEVYTEEVPDDAILGSFWAVPEQGRLLSMTAGFVKTEKEKKDSHVCRGHLDILAANERGSAVVVHAHGDNMAALKEYVPWLRRVLGTTQAEPIEGIYNFGGFSDGDRCVFLARRFGAAKIKIIGFDYDDPNVTPVKMMKLKWARRLVAMALEDKSNL